MSEANMHLIIYGPEGSGKGTQAELLSKLLKLPVYTSGDLVRETASKNKGEIGRICKEALVSGKYVPDREIFKLWKDKLRTKEAREGFILDGFPRNINQARFLFDEILKNDYQIDRVIYIKIDMEESLKRLAKRKRRLFKGSKISHDTPERIRQRLKIYHEQENKLLEFFLQQKILLEINGQNSIERVFEEITNGLGITK